MIKCLKNKITLPKCSSIKIGNAESMNFQLVDMITANAVFQWFSSPGKTLNRLNLCIRPRGKLIFSTFGPATLGEFRKIAMIESPALLIPFNHWKKLIKEAGLTIDSSASENYKTFYSNTLGLLKNLQQLGAAPIKLKRPGELRSLIRDYDKNYSTNQGVYANWELFYFSAINKQ